MKKILSRVKCEKGNVKRNLLSTLYILLFTFTAFSPSAFAQILPDNVTGGNVTTSNPIMSDEIMLNSAGELIASGEIQFDLPFDPLEEEAPILNSAGDYDLGEATNVPTGPASIVLFLMALILGSVIYTYHLRHEGQMNQ